MYELSCGSETHHHDTFYPTCHRYEADMKTDESLNMQRSD